MNGLRGETFLYVRSVVTIIVVVAVVSTIVCSDVHGFEAEVVTTSRPTERPSLTVDGGRDLSYDWLRTTVDNCRTVGWSRCVVEKLARTIRLLEEAQDFPLTDGVRLVKNAAKTTDRSAKNHSASIMDRMFSFVDSHSLQIDLWTSDDDATAEGRRRHAYRRVFPIVVGTYMIMSAVLLPLGFMFMSTLGGKALLVSKIALMISLMSNIKKIFSYEYYVPTAPAPVGHHHWKRTLLAHRTTAGPLYSSYTT